ncbi:MAG: hypothetical protein RMX68_026195 [Aulosira sp. ZfuVER01]|nr:hypothetical protein [Aulosira sp. ZfuVER01]MDZ7999432.1 hypothetical protein [Aulosira sp. DedVER01a]MDZ8054788.1 hypothetical protein [Aulosira sp. ZfuCHP01]
MPEVGKYTFLMLVILWLTSCTSNSSSKEMTKEIQNVSSWSATAHMVGDAWIHGAVPKKYAQETLKKAQEEILKERDNIGKFQPSQKAIQQHKSVVLTEVLLLANKTEKISIAITQANRAQVQKSLEELEAESRVLNRMRKIPE